MIHPHTKLAFISDEIGFGVVATQRIPEGTVTWVQDPLDRLLEPEEVLGLHELFRKPLDHFTFRDRAGRYVLCWDHGRYINHSSRSNCLTTAYDFEIAVRDIEVGEELTDDYGYLNLERPFDAAPERGTRRRRIFPDDLVRYHAKWDRQLRRSMRSFTNVEQPLAPLLSPGLLEKVVAIAEGREEMDSILTAYFPGAVAGDSP